MFEIKTCPLYMAIILKLSSSYYSFTADIVLSRKQKYKGYAYLSRTESEIDTSSALLYHALLKIDQKLNCD